jgi:hypothetical protein
MEMPLHLKQESDWEHRVETEVKQTAEHYILIFDLSFPFFK